MAQEVGKVAVKLVLNGGKEFLADVSNIGSAASKSMGSALAATGASVAKTAIAITTTAVATAASAVSTITGLAVKAYGEYEQALGGIETLYGDASDQMLEFAKQSYKTAQISTSEYLDQATKFGASLIQSLEGDTAKAAEIADLAIRDMSDNANKMGTSIEMIQNAYQGLARGQFNMLDNLRLGYKGTKTEMERLLADAEKISGVHYDISNYSDLIQAIHVIQENIGMAGTSTEEAFTTINGSMKMMKASLKDLVAGLGDPTANLEQLAGNVIESVQAMANNLLPTITRVLKNIVPAITKLGGNILTALAESLIELAPTFVQAILELATIILEDATRLLPIIAQGLRDLLQQIVDFIPTFLPVLIDFMTELAMQVAEILPNIIGTIVEGIMSIVKILVQPENITKIIQAGLALLKGLIQAIPLIIDALMWALPDIIDAIVKFYLDKDTQEQIAIAFLECLKALVYAVPRVLGILFQAFTELFRRLWERLKTTFGDFAGKFGEALSASFRSALNGVLRFIENFINGAVRQVNGFIGAINSVLSAVGGHINTLPTVSLPRLAKGGVANSATPALIGEAGKEAVIPLEHNTDNWAGLLASKLAEAFEEADYEAQRPITVVMNATINNDMDTDEMLNKLTTAMRRAV